MRCLCGEQAGSARAYCLSLRICKPRRDTAAPEQVEGDETGFYRARHATARFCMTRIVPRTSALFAAIMAGKKPPMEIEAELF